MRDSGEAVGEGNGTFLGPISRSQTRVPGLALSCPYHCTSASSEHSGLLRKQLSLKDLQRKTQTRIRLQRKAFYFKRQINIPDTITYTASSVHLLLRLFVKECSRWLSISISRSCKCQCPTTEQSTCRDQIQPRKEYITRISPPSKSKKLSTFPIVSPPQLMM